jgi:hypothetical protein
MKKFFSFILAILLVVFSVCPPAAAADREDFTVTKLTVLQEIVGAGFKIASKAMTAATDWTLSRAESLCNMLSLAASGSGDSVIVPTALLRTGDVKIVRNATDSAVTIKKYGGTGVEIAAGKTAIVVYNGSDYVRVTADATH